MPTNKNGVVRVINGKQVTLYPISVLAERLSKALGDERTPQTIRKWEQNGIIPRCIIRIGGKRMYADEQIKAICKVAKECEIKQGYSLALTNFSVRVTEELRVVNKRLLGK